MLTKIIIDNFKGLSQCEIELGQTVVFVGPNNSGKTTALQALSLWETGLHCWMARFLDNQKEGVAINRRDLFAIPVSHTKFLWKDTLIHNEAGRIPMTVTVEGIFEQQFWTCGFDFDYANSESFYCCPTPNGDNLIHHPTEEQKTMLKNLRVAFLPSMTGLGVTERRLEPGSIDVLAGEGQMAQVLRNLCYQLHLGKIADWEKLCLMIKSLFGITLSVPQYDPGRGEITVYYSERNDDLTDENRLELASAGRGVHQTLLILVFLFLHPGAIILFDEPDAHLEILRQKQIFETIKNVAQEQGGQIVVATHSEVVLNESAEKDTVIAFLGKPHKLNDKSQLKKSLANIGWEQYFLAEQNGWILYLEGSTDLDMLRAFADRLNHSAKMDLEKVFFHPIGDNSPQNAKKHFYALREAKPNLKGYALFDRIGETKIKSADDLTEYSLKRRELENYFCTKKTLIAWARGMNPDNGLFQQAGTAEQAMLESIEKIEESIKILKPDIELIWSPELKASDDVLTPVLTYYFKKTGQHSPVQKSRFHELIPFMATEEVDDEIIKVLDTIHNIASSVNS